MKIIKEDAMTILSDVPCLYIIFAILLSVYQAYRGFMFQWIWANKKEAYTKPQRVILLCLADAISYFLLTVAGFVSLLIVYRIYSRISDFSELQVGSALLLIFLTLFGILGITGQLLSLLQQGKFPGIIKP
jgi:hypothetical protein